MEIKIVRATKKDYREINKMLMKLHKLHVKARPDIFSEISYFYKKKEFKKLLKNNNVKYFVAKKDEKIIGMISLKLDDFNENICPSIGSLYVKKKYRKTKVATELINTVKKYYLKEKKNEHNCSDFITLNVFDFNYTAKQFYKNIGFNPRCQILELNVKEK